MAQSTTNLPPQQATMPKKNYEKKQWKDNKYSVKGYEYPYDLMAKRNEYGGNYVVFYINVNEDSKMLENKQVAVLSADDQKIADKERVKKNLAGQEINKYAFTAAMTAQGGLAGGTLGSIAGIPGQGGLAGAGIGLASTGTVAAQVSGSTFSRPQKRLSTAIALHVPNDLNIRYGAGWGEEDTAGMMAGYSALGGGEKLDAVQGIEGQSKQGGLSQMGSIAASMAMANAPGGKVLSALSGTAPNPKKEQVFSGVDFRTFSLNYYFAPRSSDEAKNVVNIINTFKYHMHPEYKDGKGFLFLYPSEFDVVYYHGAEENLNIHRHTSCVLTDLSINYTPNGVFNTFPDGMPTQINVQMTFKELTILTKELIAQGL